MDLKENYGWEEGILPMRMMDMLEQVQGEPFKARPVTIFRLPTLFHETNRHLCEPQMVSIGPYYHGKDSLRAMEGHKTSCLRDFLRRNKHVELGVFIREIRALEEQARKCYSEELQFDSDNFVMMLILDSCFIVEFCRNYLHSEVSPISYVGSQMSVLISDMLLLENQIPFLVMHKMLAIQAGRSCEGPCSFRDIFNVFAQKNFSSTQLPPEWSCSTGVQHLLHLLYKAAIPQDRTSIPVNLDSGAAIPQDLCRTSIPVNSDSGAAIPQDPCKTSIPVNSDSGAAIPQDPCRTSIPVNSDSGEDGDWAIIPSATELTNAGVIFKRKRGPLGNPFQISFDEAKGIMEIPALFLDSFRFVLLVNFVALEQNVSHRSNRIFTSYLSLIDALINTEKDVTLLERSGILKNMLQSKEQTADFFNFFGGYYFLNYDDNYYGSILRKLQAYSNSTWHKYRARLWRDFSVNPWTLISVVTGAIALILTFIQTVYSAK